MFTDLILPALVLIVFVLLFTWSATKLKRGGGSMSTTMHASLDSFYNREKKKAAQVVAQAQANKKLGEQTNGKDSDSETHGK